MNLLTETIKAIAASGHTPDDIVFIGSLESAHACTWAEFNKVANVEYDSGFGAAKVAKDLVIIFSDGQKMWRDEYDGSEWWEFSTPSAIPSETFPIRRLVVTEDEIGWKDIADMNKHDRALADLAAVVSEIQAGEQVISTTAEAVQMIREIKAELAAMTERAEKAERECRILNSPLAEGGHYWNREANKARAEAERLRGLLREAVAALRPKINPYANGGTSLVSRIDAVLAEAKP